MSKHEKLEKEYLGDAENKTGIHTDHPTNVLSNGVARIQKSSKEQKELEKQRKKQDAYMKSMITREEAFSIVRGQVIEQMRTFFDTIQDSLRANLVINYALMDLLIDKGLISNRDDLQPYIERVIDQIQKGEENGEAESSEREDREPEATE